MRVTMTRSSRTRHSFFRRADILCIYPADQCRGVRRRAVGTVWRTFELAQGRIYFAELLRNGLKATKLRIHVGERFHDTQRFGCQESRRWHFGVQDGHAIGKQTITHGSRRLGSLQYSVKQQQKAPEAYNASQEMDTNRGFWIGYSWST